MNSSCYFALYDGNIYLGLKKGVFNLLLQMGAYKSSLLKREAVGLPRGIDVLSTKKGDPLILVDVQTHLAFNKGESLIPDPDLIDVLSNVCETQIWKYFGSTNISLWQMLALMGAGAGVLGAVQLIIGLLK